jgi:hypothetical protein
MLAEIVKSRLRNLKYGFCRSLNLPDEFALKESLDVKLVTKALVSVI